MTMVDGANAVRLQGARVSARMFETLGVRAALGRVFGEAEEALGGDETLILSQALWRSQFGGEPAVVGRTLVLANALGLEPEKTARSYTVVGVMPAGFYFPDPHVQFWIPLAGTASS